MSFLIRLEVMQTSGRMNNQTNKHKSLATGKTISLSLSLSIIHTYTYCYISFMAI